MYSARHGLPGRCKHYSDFSVHNQMLRWQQRNDGNFMHLKGARPPEHLAKSSTTVHTKFVLHVWTTEIQLAFVWVKYAHTIHINLTFTSWSPGNDDMVGTNFLFLKNNICAEKHRQLTQKCYQQWSWWVAADCWCLNLSWSEPHQKSLHPPLHQLFPPKATGKAAGQTLRMIYQKSIHHQFNISLAY